MRRRRIFLVRLRLLMFVDIEYLVVGGGGAGGYGNSNEGGGGVAGGYLMEP